MTNSDRHSQVAANKSTSIAVVIPAYNEAATIRDLVIKTLTFIDNVIVVDDGSTDDTIDCLKDLAVTVIEHEVNKGKGESLWDGMRYALDMGADAIISLDGDGQHSPEDIPALLVQYEQNPNTLVIAARLLNRQNAPRARLFANQFADFWVSWASGQCIYDSQSGFRLYPAALLKAVTVPHDYTRGFVFESEFIIESCRKKFPCTAVPINSIYHSHARPSHFRPVLDIAKIVLMIAWKIIPRAMYLPGLIKTIGCHAKTPTRKSAD